MKKVIKKLINSIANSPFSPFFKLLHDAFTVLHYRLLVIKWYFKGFRKPTKEEAAPVSESVTFIYKSFQRQRMAKRLYRNIQKYYPGARVIIADDSKKPLKLKGKYAQVVQLPFNQGLSYGLNRALERVQTPFTMRLDDDMLLTPFSNIHGQLRFLNRHKQIDLSAVQACSSPVLPPPKQVAAQYLPFSMSNAPRPLIIPHKTKVDDSHYVLGKTSNIFLIRTDKYKSLGYDDNIRVIDHHEFFFRAAGVLVAATDVDAFVFHYHNRFDKRYAAYRSDYLADKLYIKQKHNL